MKKVKGLMAIMMILTLLVGSVGWVKASPMDMEENITFIGEYTPQEEPKPKKD